MGASTALAGGDWCADKPSAWELIPAEQWSADGGFLLQRSPGDSTDFLLANYAVPKDSHTTGDFTITARAGFNPDGYPLDDIGKPNWRIYYRTLAFGVAADSANALLAVVCRTSGTRNGIVRLVDGAEHWLTHPTGGQGVGLDLHDLREYRMSRSGNTVTVWLDSVPVFQAVDTLGLLDGRPVVCGPGAVGIALESLRLEDSAEKTPELALPAAVDSFIIAFDKIENHLLRDISGKPLGTIELGEGLLGWWSDPFSLRGWMAAGGQLSIPNYRMAPEATVEIWFRLLDVPKSGVPLLHFGFDGTVMDSTWLARERGGPMAVTFPDSSIGLHFHEFGDGNADLPGIFHKGKWTRIAWVRNGALHRIYVDNQEVLSLYLPKYGDRELTGLQLNVGQNADHDWILDWGRPYMEVRCIRAVPRALEPGQLNER